MKKAKLFLISLIFGHGIYCQTETKSLVEDFDYDNASQILSTDAAFFKYMLNNEFSKLVTGNSFTGLGQYASISTKDDNLEASLNMITNCGVLDFKIKGGSSEGITSFFEDNELNSSVGLEMAYHFKLSKRDEDYITIEIDDVRRIQDAERELNEKYKIDSIKLENKKISLIESLRKKELERVEKYEKLKQLGKDHEAKENLLLAEKQLLESQIGYYSDEHNLQKELDKLIAKRDAVDSNDPFKADSFHIDSLKLFGKKNELLAQRTINEKKLIDLEEFDIEENQTLIQRQIELLEGEISSMINDLNFYSQNKNRLKHQLRNDYIDKIRENRKKVFEIAASDVQLSWLTLGIGGTQNAYGFFDHDKPEDKQFFYENDLTWSFTLALSKYQNIHRNNNKINDRNVRFKSLGIKGNITNNIGDIGKVEVRSIEELDTTREVLAKKEAYQGTFDDNLLTAMVFYDSYRFVGNKNNIGLHFRSTFEFGNIEPKTSVRIGVVVPFKNLEEKGSFLNLELFAGLTDIFGTNDEETLFERNIIGVQATVPFNFKIL